MENIENIPLLEMTIQNELLDGISFMSLVDSPAIEQNYLLLNKEPKERIEIKLEKGDLKRHILTGPALIPNIIIPRKGYNITFSAETIRKISENFLIQNKQNNVDLQHIQPVNHVYLVETWIVEDETNDKIYKLGYTPEQIPAGTWCVSYKINDDNLWNEYLESGLLKGFSIAGSFTEKEIKLTEHNIDDDNLKQIFLAAYYTEEDLDSKYRWKLGAETDDRKNCPACIEHAASGTKTLREWINYAIPCVPNGTVIAGLSTSYKTAPYGTFCEDKCGCQLVKIVQSKSGASISMPWGKKIKSKFD